MPLHRAAFFIRFVLALRYHSNMINPRYNIWILLVFALLFQVLFSNHNMGLNCLIFMLLSSLLGLVLGKKPKSKTAYLIQICCWVSAIGVVIAHTSYSIVFFWISFLIYLASIVHTELQHFYFAPLFTVNALTFIPKGLGDLFRQSFNIKNSSNLKSWLPLVVLPLVVILVLLKLYALSNHYFEVIIDSVTEIISSWILKISVERSVFFIVGFIIGLFYILKLSLEKHIQHDAELNTNLSRKSFKRTILKFLSRRLLKVNYVAIGLFILLNIIISIINYLDIKYIWVDFKWDGGFLKDMVHQGTYLLIFAILISMAISVYYLNSNLVFIKNNKVLKTLIIVWLIQNIVMIVSVAFRNAYYIQYFALAYKRIFVYFFLVACLVGLVSIIIKTLKQKNTAFLLQVNSISIFLIFLSASLFNWDLIIAKYNFSNYKESYVHYDFLKELNNSALPYLETNKEHLHEIDRVQANFFTFDTRGKTTSDEFSDYIELRKKYFKAIWPEQSWLDWNLPESNAYKKLAN